MEKTLLHTPEGVRDILNDECERKLALQEILMEEMLRFGFHPIETPTFEFFDIFSREIGTVSSRELYKFFDREGNTLALRPDVTPQIARAAAKYHMDSTHPVRFCYQGNTFINHSSYRGRLKETTQTGAELIGVNGAAADGEMLALVVQCLKASGLTEFQISVGHARYFQALIKAAGVEEETEEALRDLLSNKNFFGAEELLDTLSMEPECRELFRALREFYPSADSLLPLMEKAKKYPEAYEALRELSDVDRVLQLYGVSSYITYELGQLSPYRYYTGILFSGYTMRVGEPVVKGGRYDELLKYFGKDEPSIGFAIFTDQLLQALSRQNPGYLIPHETELIVYEEALLPEAVKRARRLREAGRRVELYAWDQDTTIETLQAYKAYYRIPKATILKSTGEETL